jgi:hypothetical protein
MTTPRILRDCSFVLGRANVVVVLGSLPRAALLYRF